MGIISLLLRTSITGGVVYYTIQEGVWSKSEESVKFYNKIYNYVTPYIVDNIPNNVLDEIQGVPSLSNMSYVIKSNWNKGVITTMNFLANMPTHTCNAFNSLMKQPALNNLFQPKSEDSNSNK